MFDDRRERVCTEQAQEHTSTSGRPWTRRCAHVWQQKQSRSVKFVFSRTKTQQFCKFAYYRYQSTTSTPLVNNSRIYLLGACLCELDAFVCQLLFSCPRYITFRWCSAHESVWTPALLPSAPASHPAAQRCGRPGPDSRPVISSSGQAAKRLN